MTTKETADTQTAKSDPVAEIIAREEALSAIKNRTEFLVNPSIMLEFYDMESFREFDLHDPILTGQAYIDMIERVSPDFIGQARNNELLVEASETVGYSSLFETYDGYMRETREKISLVFRMTHGWKKKNGVWLLTHEHMSYPVDSKTGAAMTSFKFN